MQTNKIFVSAKEQKRCITLLTKSKKTEKRLVIKSETISSRACLCFCVIIRRIISTRRNYLSRFDKSQERQNIFINNDFTFFFAFNWTQLSKSNGNHRRDSISSSSQNIDVDFSRFFSRNKI